MLREDMEYKEAGQLYHGKSVVDQNKDSLLGESVNDNKDGCESSQGGSCSMRSIDMESQGHTGTESDLRSP